MKFLVYICRVLVGSLFIVSGLIKANDAWGFFYKLQEYAEPGALNAPILDDWGLGIGIFVCIAEILLGVALLIGALPKLTTILSVLMMVFFTFLTNYTRNCDEHGTKQWTHTVEVVLADGSMGQEEVTEEIANQCVQECGCFGNAIPLTATQSYYKDLVLLIFLLPILFWAFRNKIKLNTPQEDMYLFAASLAVMMWFCMSWLDWLFPVLFTVFCLLAATAIKRRSKSKYKEWFMAAAVLIISGVFQWYTLNHLPLKDYRPYAKGQHIGIQMQGANALLEDIEILARTQDKAKINAWFDRFESVDPGLASTLRSKTMNLLALEGSARNDSMVAIAAIYQRMGLRAPIVSTEYTFRNVHNGQDTMMLSSEWLKQYNTEWFKRNYENIEDGFSGKTVEEAPGIEPAIADLAPETYEGDYMTERLLRNGYHFLHVSNDLAKTNTKGQPALTALAKESEKNGVPFYAITNASYDEVEDYRHAHQAAYEFWAADQIEMKIIVRSNPGLVLLKDGEVIEKWAWKDFPEWSEVKGSLIP